MNIYSIVIPVLLLADYLLELIADTLNIKNIKEELPSEFSGVYDADRYRQSQRYLRDTTRFGTFSDSIHLLLMFAMIFLGGFNIVDLAARNMEFNSTIITGLIFTGILIFGMQLIDLPFSWYRTFVIEERYGFNKTTRKTFIADIGKGLLLQTIIGAPILALIIWFFDTAGQFAWFYCWAAVILIQILLVFIAPYVIMPLFNKFTPMEDGELREGIEKYAQSQNFKMHGVFTMDGSKRSAKTNAFFTGFGKSRRIVLFDTLIEKHTVDELLAIVAHEMGHYKKKHILKMMIRSCILTGFMFLLLSIFINNAELFAAFRMTEGNISVYASLIFFGFLYTPISTITGILGNVVSRKQEYEADQFAVETGTGAESMISGLKRLSVDNLSNLTPHPFTVFLHYSHPPVIQRIAALRKLRVNKQGSTLN